MTMAIPVMLQLIQTRLGSFFLLIPKKKSFKTLVCQVVSWIVLLCLLVPFLISCSFQDEHERLFQDTISEQDVLTDQKKLKNYIYIFKTSENEKIRIKSARKLIDLYFKNNEYDKVDQYLKFVIRSATSKSESSEFLQKLADNAYYNLKRYQQAILHYKSLLALNRNWVTNQLMIAKSYFNLGELKQVHIEVETLLLKKLPKYVLFETLLLKANTYFASGEFSKASHQFKEMMESYPSLSEQNHVALNYSLSLEEQGFIDKAVGVLLELKKTYHSPAFIDSKVEHLYGKMKNRPGSRESRRYAR